MHTSKIESIDELIIATKILVNEQVIDGFGHASVRDRDNAIIIFYYYLIF